MKALGRNIRYYRKRKGWKQRQLAETICGLLSDPKKLGAYAKAAKQRAADFGEETYAERFCRLAEDAGKAAN